MSTVQISPQRQPDTNALKNADRLWHLQKTGLTEGLSLREMHFLAASCADLIFEKNQIIYHQGDPAESLLFVNRGTVRLSVASFGGKEKLVGLLGIGTVFGEEIFNKSPRRRNQATAHEEAWISLVEHKTLKKLAGQIPALSLNLLRIMDSHLREAHQEIEILSFGGTEKRIAKTLLKLCFQHGKAVISPSDYKKLRIPVSHENLAQMIGANRPHVSSIMSQFRKNGVIQYQGRKLLVNEERLNSILENQES